MKCTFLPQKRRHNIVPSLADKTDRPEVVVQGIGAMVKIIVMLDSKERKDVSQKRWLQGMDPNGTCQSVRVVLILLMLMQVGGRVVVACKVRQVVVWT